MIVKDEILSVYGSCGVRHYARIILDSDEFRKTDEWLLDASSPNLTLGTRTSTGPEDFFSTLLQTSAASFDANYDGEFNGGTSGWNIDKIREAIFTITEQPLALLTGSVLSGTAQKPFIVSSFHFEIGEPDGLILHPRTGPITRLDVGNHVIILNEKPLTDLKHLFHYLLTETQATCTPYFGTGSKLSGVAFETNE